jgi:hypothetical protein
LPEITGSRVVAEPRPEVELCVPRRSRLENKLESHPRVTTLSQTRRQRPSKTRGLAALHTCVWPGIVLATGSWGAPDCPAPPQAPVRPAGAWLQAVLLAVRS